MAYPIRFRTSAFLWLMLAIALCAGWMADRRRFQHQLNQMTDLVVMQRGMCERLEIRFLYAERRNIELRQELREIKSGNITAH